jgi:hypothetical protein
MMQTHTHTHSILITLVIVVAIALIHFSYVDFRFRYREGMAWFWLLNPAPPVMWFGRLTIVLTVIAAIALPFIIGMDETYAFIVGGLMLLHLLTLILMEVFEPR